MSLFSAVTFRTLGAAATTQNIFTLENAAGSGRRVRIRRMVFQMDATAVLTAVMPLFKTSRTTALPTGGTALGKAQFDTSVSSVAGVVARGANASDGGAATAITATAGTIMWQQYGMRMHTLVGQVLGADNNVMTAIAADNPVILQPGEAILVQCVAAATTSNPATNHYFVQAAWDEEVI
jgi:hypothetical protein